MSNDLEIKNKIYDLIIGKLPEEALDSDMSLNIVDNSIICEWKSKDERNIIIYGVDIVINSHSIEQI